MAAITRTIKVISPAFAEASAGTVVTLARRISSEGGVFANR
jgi:hypothetical protein